MSSPGQIIGGIAGAAIGFFFGSPILGAQIGMMVGGAIDPPKGPSITGPRLEDLSVQTATYGAPLPRGYGTVCVSGNIFWLENDQIKESTATEEQGGKGGGGQDVTSYHYSATFAVGLMHAPAGATVSLRRLWIDTDLVYEAASVDVGSIIASQTALENGAFTFYAGADEQLPNYRMQADKGAGNVSGYPGLCYIVFEDLNLEKYSNTLLRVQVKAELVVGPATVSIEPMEIAENNGTSPHYRYGSFNFSSTGCRYVKIDYDPSYATPAVFNEYNLLFSDYQYTVSSYAIDAQATSQWHIIEVAFSDRPFALFQKTPVYPGDTKSWLLCCESGGAEFGEEIPIESFPIGGTIKRQCAIAGAELFIFSADANNPVWKFSSTGFGPYAVSPANYQAISGGLSENFLFLLKYESGLVGTTTIYRLRRDDLTLDATWTASEAIQNGVIDVHDDETVYTASANNPTAKWVSGSVVATFSGVTSADFNNSGQSLSSWFKMHNDSPVFATWYDVNSDLYYRFQIAHTSVAAQSAALRDIVTDECALAGIAASDIDLAELTNFDVRGFRVAQRGAVRNALELLQAAYPFDVAQSGYKIRFVSRGGASVASIPEVDLAATDGQIGVLLPVTREMDSQLPFRVSIRYADPDREYDIGEQAVERFEKDSLNERVMELPLSLTSAEAIQMADVLLAKDWTERTEFGPFSLPPTWLNLEPADVVTVTHRGQEYTLRLTRVEYLPDGRLVCSAKLTAAASYTSSATAQSPLVSGKSLLQLAGSTTAYLLDIPRIDSAQDVHGLCYGMTGMASGWPGATLVRSDDSGNTYQAIGAVNSRVKVFTASGTMGSHHGYSIDHESILTVTPRYFGHTLSSVSEEAFYSGASLAAYGNDGRWEIVAFKTAIDNTGSYSLNNFLRGLYGSKWASGLHVAGDYFIMLDTATISFFGLATNALGVDLQYRAITQGSGLDSAADVVFNYQATNLKPLSPVDFVCLRDELTNDLTFMWQRRSRWETELLSGAVVPLAESTESYALAVYADSEYETAARTFSISETTTAQYTYAEQLADFGSPPSTVYASIAQVSSVVGNGFLNKSAFSVPAFVDPYLANVVLLMHMDDTGCTDQNGHVITLAGNAARVASSGDFGGYALGLDGSGDYASTPNATDLLILSGGDYTVEAFITPAATPATAYGYVVAALDYNNNGWQMRIDNGGGSFSLVYPGAVAYSKTHTFVTGQRVHVAICRSGTTHYVCVNGAVSSSSSTNRTTDYTGTLRIGSGNYAGAEGYFNGKIDEVRITKGVARYTGAYSVPTSAFQNP